MKILSPKLFLTVIVLLSVVQLFALESVAPDFWHNEPRPLTERYVEAYNNYDEDWVLDFADSLDMLSELNNKPQYRYFASELRCHNAFINEDSTKFFQQSEIARRQAIEFGFVDYYFAETTNIVSFYMNNGDNRKAQKVAEQMLVEAREMNCDDGLYYGHFALGTIYRDASLYNQSIENYQKCFQYLDPEDFTYEGSLAQINAFIAFDYMEMGDYDSAIEYGEKSDQYFENSDDVYFAMAISYFNKGDYAKFDDYSAMYIIDDERPSLSYEYFCNYLMIYRKALEGNGKEAIKLADQIEDDRDRYTALSNVYKVMRDWEHAFEFQSLAAKEDKKILERAFDEEIASLDAEIAGIYEAKKKDERMLFLRFAIILIAFIVFASVIIFIHISIHHGEVIRSQQRELQASKRYFNLVENAPFAYSKAKLYFDEEGNVTDYRTVEVNKVLKDSMKFSHSVVGAKTIMEAYPQSGPKLISKINEARSQKLPFIRFPYHLSEYDRYYELIMIFDDTEFVQIFSLNNTDVLKARELIVEKNEELMIAKEKLEKSDKVKTKFIQNMSHEVRTPLNAIVGFSQLLTLPDGMITDEERQEYGRYILNNSDLLTMLVNDILDVSDIDSGKYNVVISPVNCNEVCKAAVNTAQTRVDSNVELRFTTDIEDGYTFVSDPRRIQQILINFLSNACKNTHEGFIELHCTKNDSDVIFTCTDTGCGVPPEKKDVIFERFSKLNDFVQGSGLGLNICQDLAIRLGGEIGLDTSYTDGARFYLRIPLETAI